MFKKLSSVGEKALARELAASIQEDLPPGLMADRSKSLSVNKITRLLERAYERAAEHQQTHRLGFFKRAVLANTLKWELKEAGYPEDFIDIAVEGLVVALTKAANAKTA